MARPLRTWDDSALYHVIFKGNFGQPIVCDLVERLELQRRLGAAAKKYEVIILAFCCMDTTSTCSSASAPATRRKRCRS
jgi:hypothetical protein